MIGVDLAMVAALLPPGSGAAGRHPGFPPLWVTLFVLIACICSTTVQGDLVDDARGLTVFRQAVDPGNLLQWSGNDVCHWRGITCSTLPTQTSQRVTAIRLPGASLIGPIPLGSISQLTQLRVLSLRSNKLSGTIPNDLTNCSFLRSIYLQDNEISGSLPANFSLWPNLVHLDSSLNNIGGEMPASLADLKQLKSLLLQNNSLTGSIPALDIPALTKLNVSYNQLSGPIPDTATYARFGKSSFLGNNLCGGPLPPCINPPASAPSLVTPSGNGPHKKKLSGGAIAGIVIAGVILLLLVCLLCCLAYKKSSKGTKRPNPFEARSAEPSATVSEYVSMSRPMSEPVVAAPSEPERKGLVFIEGNKHSFDLEDLLRASAEVLGKGSVGTSYKAVLETGPIVAVKRLKDVSIEKREFEQRMEQIGRIKHENLVPLVAYYYSREEKLLVSNYMANGSLSALLHGNKEANRTPLNWDTRVRIALGSALGINYLHEEGLTHGNIKSSNILLTSNFNGCVSDYGLTQLSSASPAANRMAGYRAPELIDLRKATPKTDVYSFGVLVLELLTGRPPSNASASDEGIDLPRWVQSMSREEEDWISKVFDPQLTRFEGFEDEMVHILDIALECVKPSPDQRPTMKEIVAKLQHYKQHDDGIDEF